MKLLSLVLALAAGTVGWVYSQAAPKYLDARASDPKVLGWMQGAPPAAEKVIRFEDESFFRFPQMRWTFSHWSEIFPTVRIRRGPAQSVLEKAERADLDSVRFTPLGATREMTWRESLEANYTDGIVVLHRGRIVYERYFGALEPERHHIAFSVTKSFIAVVFATLAAEGRIDWNAPVARYLPELKNSGFADATLAQVADMTSGLQYVEDYADPKSNWHDYKLATQFFPRPAGYAGPMDAYAYLATIPKLGEHGPAFKYRSINTDVLGWVMARVTGKTPAALLEERLWGPLGMEDDGFLAVGPAAIQFVAGGLNCRLRDLARFGEMMRLNGRYNRQQIVPAAVVAEIRKGGSPVAFAKAGYATLPGWSYRTQWWVSHNEHGAIAARGIHGQGIYVDPKAEMVIARFASHPLAGNVNLDPATLPAYDAVARWLMAASR
ncbi:MAG: serine hydrolase [Acidobacteria bacterium]|nr:serine hydrolase [Acidobacteriota bacterium]